MATSTKHIEIPVIKIKLNTTFRAVSNYMVPLSENDFLKPYGGKWSTAEHFAHLTMSAFPVTNALKQTKFFFRAFGTAKNGSLPFDDLHHKYKQVLANGMRATTKYVPTEKEINEKATMLKNWESIRIKFEERLINWTEKDLDKYRVPHPALGKVTFRELLYFTIFHTEHHLDILKNRALQK